MKSPEERREWRSSQFGSDCTAFLESQERRKRMALRMPRLECLCRDPQTIYHRRHCLGGIS